MEDDAMKHGGAQGREKLAGLAEHAKRRNLIHHSGERVGGGGLVMGHWRLQP